MAQRITLDDVRAMDREMLSPQIVGPILGVAPYWLTLTARDHPERIKIPFIRTGSRGQYVKFPRLAFIAWMEGQQKVG